MRRRCTGQDPYLVMLVDVDGQRVERSTSMTKTAPCDCGLTFDDVKRQVPHPEV